MTCNMVTEVGTCDSYYSDYYYYLIPSLPKSACRSVLEQDAEPS